MILHFSQRILTDAFTFIFSITFEFKNALYNKSFTTNKSKYDDLF